MITTKEEFASAIEAFFNCSESEIESKLLNIFTKDTVLTINEKRMTWDDFFPYFRGINKSMSSAQIKSDKLVQNGNLFAERHTASGTGKDGTKTQARAICMFEVNEDGKIIWLEEVLHFSAGTDTTTIKYE